MHILIKFWPFLLITLVILIWFIASRKNKDLKITNMKIWVLTIFTTIVIFLILVIYNFMTTDTPPSDYKRIESYGTNESDISEEKKNNKDNIIKFDAGNVPKEIP